MTGIEEDEEKIRVFERFARGEITESEARDQLGDDIIESMRQEREAFRAAMQRDTSNFLTDDRDFEKETEWDEPPEDVDEDELEAELAELESELEDELGDDKTSK